MLASRIVCSCDVDKMCQETFLFLASFVGVGWAAQRLASPIVRQDNTRQDKARQRQYKDKDKYTDKDNDTDKDKDKHNYKDKYN